MVHKFKGKRTKYIKTTYLKGVEYDVYKLPNGKIVAYYGGTGNPARIWDNIKDFQFTEKVFNL
jgi:hypothetical protein